MMKELRKIRNNLEQFGTLLSFPYLSSRLNLIIVRFLCVFAVDVFYIFDCRSDNKYKCTHLCTYSIVSLADVSSVISEEVANEKAGPGLRRQVTQGPSLKKVQF